MRARFISSSAVALCAALVPALASAATLLDTLALANTFLNAAIGLFITLAIVVFFWGMIRYLWSNSGEEKAKSLQTMMYGVIVIFVMVSIWGIIRLLQSTFKVTSTDPIVPKGVNINTGRY